MSGGTGTPKLLQGFRQLIPDDEIGVICNTGDDLSWFGLHVSPDLDTILYLFAGKLDTEKFWGVVDETYQALSTIKSLGQAGWFNIGDRDLGLHLVRSQMLLDHNLSEVTETICQNWDISSKIYPMSNFPLRSIIHTELGKLPFQEYFVKHNWQPEVHDVSYEGRTDTMPEQVENLLTTSQQIILGPSNPVTSIGPILAIDPIDQLFKNIRDKVTAISPIVGDRAFSGPSTHLMEAIGMDVSVVGLAEHYKDKVSTIIFSEDDRKYREDIEDTGVEPVFLPIELQTSEQKKQLANSILDLF